ncbi:ribonuclease D [Lichenicola sp.]|uniref:ribonuclease D n=1 Tax=Lichenicola sp. TaxID=2804529 RepID=UPI003B00E9EC
MSRPARARFPDPILITTSDALAAVVERLRTERFVTIDTEFVRERTYWPELCVVQLAGENEVAIIDAEAEGLDLQLLAPLLDDPAVTKVFHAARQDLEIFLYKFGRLPQALFDTQVAAMVAGFGDQVGYDSLVSALTGGQIDKAHRFSDWSRRPLSPAQIAYAAADVTHLRDVYVKLLERLQRDGRDEWVGEEMACLSDPATFRPNPDTLWERLRPRTGNRRMLGVLRAVAAWREREAQRVDVPRQRLLKDESLLEIAATAPTTAEALSGMRGVSRGFAEGKSGSGLLEAIAGAQALPEDSLPAAPRKDGPRPSPALVSLLKVLLAAKCEQHDVAPRLLASSEDIDRLATESEPEIPALSGWRRELFGADALSLKEGRISLGVDGRRIRMLRT